MNTETSSLAFCLRATSSDGRLISIRAFDAGFQRGKVRLDIEVRVAGAVLFPRGFLYVGVPYHQAMNGAFAKELVCSCVAMKPGDTDSEYFDAYCPQQITFAKANSDILNMKAAGYL